MGKILGRIAVLLLAAGIVTGGVYLFFGTSFGRSLVQTSRGGFERDFNQNLTGQSNSTLNLGDFNRGNLQGGFQGGFRGREFGGGFGLGGILRDLGVIALITAIWLMLGKVFTAFFRRRSRSRPSGNS